MVSTVVYLMRARNCIGCDFKTIDCRGIHLKQHCVWLEGKFIWSISISSRFDSSACLILFGRWCDWVHSAIEKSQVASCKIFEWLTSCMRTYNRMRCQYEVATELHNWKLLNAVKCAIDSTMYAFGFQHNARVVDSNPLAICSFPFKCVDFYRIIAHGDAEHRQSGWTRREGGDHWAVISLRTTWMDCNYHANVLHTLACTFDTQICIYVHIMKYTCDSRVCIFHTAKFQYHFVRSFTLRFSSTGCKTIVFFIHIDKFIIYEMENVTYLHAPGWAQPINNYINWPLCLYLQKLNTNRSHFNQNRTEFIKVQLLLKRRQSFRNNMTSDVTKLNDRHRFVFPQEMCCHPVPNDSKNIQDKQTAHIRLNWVLFMVDVLRAHLKV